MIGTHQMENGSRTRIITVQDVVQNEATEVGQRLDSSRHVVRSKVASFVKNGRNPTECHLHVFHATRRR